MRHGDSWIAKAAALAVVAILGIAVMDAQVAPVEPAGTGGAAGPAFCAVGENVIPESGQTFTGGTVDPDRPGEIASTALCKLRPECWRDSDCDVRCGTGLGKCVHSNCPIRICVCR